MRSFVLESEDRSPLPAPLPGQFLVFRLELDHPTLRSYSMSGPQGVGTYRISVKRAEGVGSRFFHDRIHAGDMLQVSAPRGSFTLAAGDNPVVLLSGGIGATPVLAMLHSLSAAQFRPRDLVVLRHAQSQRAPVYRGNSELLAHLPRSRSFIAYSKPEDGDQPG